MLSSSKQNGVVSSQVFILELMLFSVEQYSQVLVHSLHFRELLVSLEEPKQADKYVYDTINIYISIHKLSSELRNFYTEWTLLSLTNNTIYRFFNHLAFSNLFTIFWNLFLKLLLFNLLSTILCS